MCRVSCNGISTIAKVPPDAAESGRLVGKACSEYPAAGRIIDGIRSNRVRIRMHMQGVLKKGSAASCIRCDEGDAVNTAVQIGMGRVLRRGGITIAKIPHPADGVNGRIHIADWMRNATGSIAEREVGARTQDTDVLLPGERITASQAGTGHQGYGINTRVLVQVRRIFAVGNRTVSKIPQESI